MKIRWRPSVGLLIAAAWTLYGVLTMHGHGLTNDEPGLYYAGDRTLFWLTHPGTTNALDLTGAEPEAFRADFARHPDWGDPVHYPVFPSLVGAITSGVFHEGLHWLDVVDGHHLGLVLLQAFALAAFWRWATRLLGPLAGTAATIALALYPSAVGHAFNNPKDWPCTMFSGVALLAAGAGIVEGRGRPLVSAGIFFGLALSCKLNAVIPMMAVAIMAPVGWLVLYRGQRRLTPGLIAGALVMPYVAFALFCALWPWLWQGKGVATFWKHLNEYVAFMLDYGTRDRPWWTAYPFKAVFFMTPPIVLAAALAGAVSIGWARRAQAFTIALLLVAFALPLVRIAAPGSNFYDANRHFLDYLPPLCALAGLGVAAIARAAPFLLRRLPRPLPVPRGTDVAAATLAGLVAAWPIAEYRPHETVYFNVFAGGLGGAQRMGLFRVDNAPDGRVNGTEGDYWWSSIRAGVEWAHAREPGAPVALCGGARELLPLELRQSVTFSDANNRQALVFVGPREGWCRWATVRDLESKRPILRRVERGKGLVWEVLGPETGSQYEPLTMENAYTRPN